jgi:hypothetical protein
MDEPVSTNEIMEFLQDHMVMKEEFESRMNRQKLEFLDSMDEKLATLKGDLIVLMRGEDKKLSTLIEVLASKQVLSQDEAQSILAMHPFPQMTRS